MAQPSLVRHFPCELLSTKGPTEGARQMNDLQRALLEILVLDVRPDYDDELEGHPAYRESRPPQGDDPQRHQIAWAFITRGTKPGEVDAEIAEIARREQAHYDALRRKQEAERREPPPEAVPKDVRKRVTNAIAQAREYLEKFAQSTLAGNVRRDLLAANSVLNQCHDAESWTLERQVRVSNALASGIEYIASRPQVPTIRDRVVNDLRTARAILASAEWPPSTDTV